MKNEDMPASPLLDPSGAPLKVVVIGPDESTDNKGWSETTEMNCIGLTKLEAFTMAAMQGLCANACVVDGARWNGIESVAVSIAKATLAELENE